MRYFKYCVGKQEGERRKRDKIIVSRSTFKSLVRCHMLISGITIGEYRAEMAICYTPFIPVLESSKKKKIAMIVITDRIIYLVDPCKK